MLDDAPALRRPRERAVRGVVKITAAAVLLAGTAQAFFGHSHDAAALSEGSRAPAFQAERPDGTTFDSGALRGRPVVLNFWATWCPPCVEELPSLEGLHRALGAEGLAVVAVSVDDEPQELRRFVARQRLTLDVLRDPGTHAVARRYGVEAFPTTFVLDADGVVRGVYVGPAEWDTPGALAHFRKLLASPRPPAASRTTATP